MPFSPVVMLSHHGLWDSDAFTKGRSDTFLIRSAFLTSSDALSPGAMGHSDGY